MKYDCEYYIMSPNYDFKGYKVTPTESTSLRRFHYREQIYGEPALRFKLKGNQGLKKDSAMLFCIPSYIISSALKEIINGKIYGGKLYPALINDYQDEFYLINFYDRLDCWDRKKSKYENFEPDEKPHVIKYSLDKSIIKNLKESERLIFKMGGDDLSPVIVHEKIKRKIEKMVPYVKFFSLDTYSLGDE